MSIIHTLIADRSQIVCEHLQADALANSIIPKSRLLLQNALKNSDEGDMKRIALQNQTAFVFMRQNAWTFATICDGRLSVRQVFDYLNAVNRAFKLFVDRMDVSFASHADFAAELAVITDDWCQKLNTAIESNPDLIGKVEAQIEEATGVLGNNAKKLAERSEKLDELDNRMDFVSEVAGDYQAYSKEMSEQEKKRKMQIAGGAACVFLVFCLPW
eukprot:CAMPEP_0168593512 /NCGR_PEP_ID=MMETSP0420-20121227/8358_1 /TAXON_ID=498008 /ORGANISM="Pessonella sp." /LENGTH=214 /DNA_ID=CAMNT_0008629677 /DNA_START=23 /DNA_END=664 /DNA_ORIENTATION=+